MHLRIAALALVLSLVQSPFLLAKEDIRKHPLSIGKPVAAGGFDLLVEPSGVTALDDNTLLVVEDEMYTALRRLSLTSSSLAEFSFEEADQLSGKSFFQRQLLGPLDDLEAIARESSERFFIIASHEDANLGTRPGREKIALLHRQGNDITSASMRRDLFDQMVKYYPLLRDVLGKKKNTLNIEGMALDRRRQRLLIGFRSPLLDKQSIIVSLNNPVDYLHGEDPEFAPALKLLKLSKHGIRAMSYDDLSDRLLIVSAGESKGNRGAYLWTLSAEELHSPIRHVSDDKKLFENVEGLTTVAGGVLFIKDRNGKKKKADDAWFVLERSQIGLDSHP